MVRAKVSGDEVPEKLKQNINTVQILKLMMAFHDGTSLDVATKVGDYNTLMYGQFSLATSMSSHSVTASLVKLNQYHSVSPVRSASTSRRQVYCTAL